MPISPKALPVLATVLLAGCVSSSPDPAAPPRSAPTRPAAATPPQQPDPPPAAFRVPRVMNLPGLEDVIGRKATALANLFGAPRLEVEEGDARKLQFGGEPCVLDIYLYPLRPGAEPSATYVDARRASDGREVDRASCVAALRR